MNGFKPGPNHAYHVELPEADYWRRQIKCQDACPVHTDARGYVRAIALGNCRKAYLIARGPNPLASICGAPCEAACRRGDYDQLVGKTLQAAEELARGGIAAEVIDLRVLRPLDAETILASVAKTHRAVIIDEGWKTGSFAAKVSAQIMERAFYELDAPVMRVCSAEVPIPYAGRLEDSALPEAKVVVKTVQELLEKAART